MLEHRARAVMSRAMEQAKKRPFLFPLFGWPQIPFFFPAIGASKGPRKPDQKRAFLVPPSIRKKVL